ncbi:MAG: methyltransferase domain-containing protein [Chloroflexi bacterium OHK40]
MSKYTRKVGPPPPARGLTSAQPVRRIELAVPAGLEPLARRELRRLGREARVDAAPAPGVIGLAYSGELRRLLGLRLVTSAALLRSFAVPRPRALLGDEHLRAALALCETAIGLHPPGSFRTLFLSAAGADTAVLRRLKAELAGRLGLEPGADDGDLLLRLRRGASGAGWELLARLSPRPLATRAWRVCNREGALNGSVACAMATLSGPDAGDTYLNIGCGSGTLLIERLQLAPARRALGCDTSPEALDCARANLEAAGLAGRCELHQWDARALPLPGQSVDVIVGDLPFGHLVGSHVENLALYPALLAEGARVARPGARCVLLTHEVRLMERLLAHSDLWRVEAITRVDLGGLFPRIFQLRRR